MYLRKVHIVLVILVLSSAHAMVLSCKLCCFRCGNKLQFVKHLFEVHPSEKHACGIQGCSQTFSSYSSFLSHANRKHSPNWRRALEDQTAEAGPSASVTAPITETVQDDIDHTDPLIPEDNRRAPSLEQEDLQHVCALFLITLKEKYRLTQSAINFATKSVERIVDLAVQQHGSSPPVHVNPFEGLETEYLQTKYYRNNFHLVEPETIELGVTWGYQRFGTQQRLVEKKDNFQYIPLIKNLEALLQNEKVYSEVLKQHQRNDEFLADFCDGSLFKTHPLFGSKPDALELITYYDDVEVCNPLGAHRGVHKLALFYYVLGNIHPKLRSTLRTIQLIACVTTENLDTYGFQKVLQPFIDDVNTLAKGITVEIRGSPVTIHGTALVLLSDTLAAHSIGGFKGGVGFSLRKCRDCLATNESLNRMFKAKDFTPRTPETYDYHCSLLTGPLSSFHSTTYGVNSRSALNCISNFHVANSQLPQDVMHVLLEGVVKRETEWLIREYFHNRKYFTIGQLNERIRCFDFSPEEARDKPTPFTADGSLHQSAAQMWNLAVYLPLIIGKKVPVGDDLWECYLLLLDILQICTARIVSPSLAGYLEALIDQHHQSVVRCYPGASLTPKHHYMVHFPSLLLKVGPLISSWCMRMEAKNSYFKAIARISNFKNIAYSVAKRHQLLLCAELQKVDFFSCDMEYGAVRDPSPLSFELPFCREKLQSLLGNPPQDTLVYRPKWIKSEGIVYRLAAFVVLAWQEDDLPKFCRLEDILVVQNRFFFIATTFITQSISQHFHSYCLQKEGHRIFVVPHDLISQYPLYGHSVSGYLYLTLHSHIENTTK